MAELSTKAPDPMDIALGAAVRIRRRTIGISQEALADQCGVSFQQIQKNERGTNRIGLVQGALVPLIMSAGGIRVVNLPFEPTPLVNALWWHPVHGRDPEHDWMRGLFEEAGRVVAAQTRKED